MYIERIKYAIRAVKKGVPKRLSNGKKKKMYSKRSGLRKKS